MKKNDSGSFCNPSPLLLILLVVCITGCSSLLPGNDTAAYPPTYLKGVNIFFMPPRNAYTADDFSESLDRLTLDGVNTLFLIPYYFSSNGASSEIVATSQTITDSYLKAAITLAQERGFRVYLKPHIDLLNGKPRYTIVPANLTVWGLSYQSFIDHYLAIATACAIDGFVLGTELDGVADTDVFMSIAKRIRNSFSGELLYAASYDHFITAKVNSVVDAVGVDAYFNLDSNDPPSRATIMESTNYWLTILSEQAAKAGKPVIITEVGFCSRTGVTSNPGRWDGAAAVDLTLQEDCYEALLSQAANFKNIRGIAWWQWELGRVGGSANTDYTPRGKPAELVLQRYWGSHE